MYNKAKQIDTRVYRVRELSFGDTPEVSVYKVEKRDQPVELLTKGLPNDEFNRHSATLMGE